jgi:Flp pilus assembly protein TadD
MDKRIAGALAAASVMMLGGVAHAQQPNRYGYDQIAAKNMTAAESRLVAQRLAEPNEPSVLLNLAFVYKKTNRTAEAEALYNAVLAQPDVLMALGSGKPASSHMLAMRGLGRPMIYAGR